MPRLSRLFWPVACLLLVALGLYVRREQLARLPPPKFLQTPGNANVEAAPPSSAVDAPPAPTLTVTATAVATPSTTTHHETLSRETIQAYINAIMKPEATDLPRLHCPQPDTARYQPLQATVNPATAPPIQYFFAIDLRQCLPLLPRLIGSVVEAIRFLGPQHCALSIVEGNSDDGTGEVLVGLRPELEALGATYHFQTSDLNPTQGDRIDKLAQLRNLALQPLLSAAEPSPYSANTTVIFLNDVAICAEDILELAHQRRVLGADMTCGMDWTYVGADPTFYDVWIARTLAGDSFFDIPPDGNWNSAWNLFWNHADSRARFAAHRPFQVFSCWNGAAVFSAAPLLEDGVAFRTTRPGECAQGEPQLFCKDLWFYGYGKIAVVPAVNLEYSDEAGRRIKDAKGYASRWVGAADYRDEQLEWQLEPPEGVKCMAVYDNQTFEPWNKTQPGT
ncbi:glycosyltransferase family 69 protein [Trichocladium antarcticum]|uniref:Glycosyltransferase family 69 protein n=1 Tax=Trichocladium antarcticum TaxID=1450529 RepID=A0AAN6UJT8_9PEZI|nr:glycosyltransferase family 69 protein [Trichocladium antarcticum]